MEIVSWAQAIISVIALVVSILAFRSSRKTQVRQLQIEESREHDRLRESRQASVVARLAKESRGHGFILSNQGKGEAREITVLLDGIPLLLHGSIDKSGNEIRLLGPQGEARYPFAAHMGDSGLHDVQITWVDESSIPGRYSTTLTI